MRDVIRKMTDAFHRVEVRGGMDDDCTQAAARVLIEDMREWGGTTTIYDEKTWRQHVDEYAKSRGIE